MTNPRVATAAVATTDVLEAAHAIPTNKLKIKVKTMSIGRPYGRTASQQHPITKEIPISKTDWTSWRV